MVDVKPVSLFISDADEVTVVLSIFKVLDEPILTLPVKSPVKDPEKLVDVIEVAPVMTPPSILIVSSNTIADPVLGVIFKSPDDELIKLPSKLILSTVKEVNVPIVVIFGCDEVDIEPVNVEAVKLDIFEIFWPSKLTFSISTDPEVDDIDNFVDPEWIILELSELNVIFPVEFILCIATDDLPLVE